MNDKTFTYAFCKIKVSSTCHCTFYCWAYLLSDKSIGAGDLWYQLTCCLTRGLEQVTCDNSLPAVCQEYWSRWLVVPAYLLSDKSVGAGDLWYQLTCCLTRVLEQVTCGTSFRATSCRDFFWAAISSGVASSPSKGRAQSLSISSTHFWANSTAPLETWFQIEEKSLLSNFLYKNRCCFF